MQKASLVCCHLKTELHPNNWPCLGLMASCQIQIHFNSEVQLDSLSRTGNWKWVQIPKPPSYDGGFTIWTILWATQSCLWHSPSHEAVIFIVVPRVTALCTNCTVTGLGNNPLWDFFRITLGLHGVIIPPPHSHHPTKMGLKKGFLGFGGFSCAGNFF